MVYCCQRTKAFKEEQLEELAQEQPAWVLVNVLNSLAARQLTPFHDKVSDNWPYFKSNTSFSGSPVAQIADEKYKEYISPK